MHDMGSTPGHPVALGMAGSWQQLDGAVWSGEGGDGGGGGSGDGEEGGDGWWLVAGDLCWGTCGDDGEKNPAWLTAYAVVGRVEWCGCGSCLVSAVSRSTPLRALIAASHTTEDGCG